jgi:nitronate monooxygenase
MLDRLRHPIVQAPLGGGPSTPELAAAVAEAGGLGFLAAGYKAAAAVEREIEAARRLSGGPLGVNLFVPTAPAEPASYRPYVDALAADAARLGAEPGDPRHSDDDWEAKLELVRRAPVDVVSLTFGCPDRTTISSLREAGVEVWVTVTSPAESETAAAAGADALVVQGAEAGAHRGSFDDAAGGEDIGLLALLQLIGAAVPTPMVATGGIANGAGIAAVLAAGAAAAQIGTALMLAAEAGTSEVHRAQLRRRSPTTVTRAFTGRRARAIVNRFVVDHPDAPSAYPELHYATAPIRAAAREAGDPDVLNLWAGQAHELVREGPAAEIIEAMAAEARASLEAAARRL